tara:strand:- start:5988 stop:6749 length:762 start_codon:yes stop_codon:yes gene_type:complete
MKIHLYYIHYYFKLNNYNHINIYKSTNVYEKIPKILYQTYIDKNKIPEKVFKNLNEYANDYDYRLFDDKDCYYFIKNNFNKDILDCFINLKGAHKADLVRYCLLYKTGGVYLDIKIILKKKLSNIFKKKYLYTCESIVKNTIFQGIIASPPNNIIFLELINFILLNYKQVKNIMNYLLFCYDFGRKIINYTNSNLLLGLNKNKKYNVDFYIFKEKNIDIKYCNNKLDRYNICTGIYDNQELIFLTRYHDYPWH